jgi:hypothetical protein
MERPGEVLRGHVVHAIVISDPGISPSGEVPDLTGDIVELVGISHHYEPWIPARRKRE